MAVQSGFQVQFPGFENASFDPVPDLVIFDLESVSDTELADAMSQLNSMDSPPKTVAYGPHVKEAKLEAAKQAGVEMVWTRGQFNKGFATLFGT